MFLLRRLGPVGIALALTRAAMATRNHWREIPQTTRLRLRMLLRKSKGSPGNLSTQERRELLGLMSALRPFRLIRRLIFAAVVPKRA